LAFECSVDAVGYKASAHVAEPGSIWIFVSATGQKVDQIICYRRIRLPKSA